MNKKLLALAATGLLCATGVSAHDFEVDGIYYNITSEVDKTVEVTFSDDFYNAVEYEYSGSVTIPETVNYNDNTYSVTSIGYSAFSWCSNLTSVVIPNSVTTIWEDAFWGCSSLTSIAVAEDNPRYDSRNNCNAIIETQTNTLIVGCSNTTIPNSVTSIGYSAFSWCSSLTSVEIPNSVTSIGDYAFYECSSLTSVEIPNSVTSIGLSAFSGTALYNNQPDGVVYLDTYLLGYKGTMPSNTSIKIKEGTLQIANYAFDGCDGLTSVVIPNSVTSIGLSAFRDCRSLTSVELPNSEASIGDYAFEGCDGLTSVVIPDSVTSIGDYAFSGCDGLTSVEIPNSVTSIGDNIFNYSYNLSSITVAENNPIYDSRDNCNAIIETQTNTLIVGCSKTTIPNSVTSIGDYAFCHCYNLTSVEIPNSVTSIEWGAFYGCSGLTSVVIPNSVTSIGGSAFWGCSSLTSVEIPNSVTHIGYYAFQSCSGLTTITSNLPADKLSSVDDNVFDGVDKTNCTLYVPYGAQAAYAYTEGWEDFENIVEMDPPSFDLTVSNAGYATLYLDYTAQIPEGVSVYTAKEVDGDLLKMEPVAGVLPANTGVVVKAPAGTYTFTYSDAYAPEISDNLFKGSATYEYVDVASTQTAFVLSKVDGEVGMYPAKLTDGRFLNNANKAYLLLDGKKLGVSDEELDTSVGGSQLSLRFNFGGTTGVDKVQTESGADAVIYDLYGRKVNKATTPGFYIINNKKVWVK